MRLPLFYNLKEEEMEASRPEPPELSGLELI